MFDTYVTRESPAYPQEVTVIEKRAPTDKSVKLLREMEDAARKEVISSVRLESNEFKCVLHSMHDVMGDEMKYRAIFSLNGKQMQAEHSARRWDSKEDTVIALRDAIAKQIANTSLQFVVRDVFKS